MQNYDIQSDLLEQRQGRLKILFLLTLFVGVPIVVISAGISSETSIIPFVLWLGLLAVPFIANKVSSRLKLQRFANLSPWIYLIALVGALSFALWRSLVLEPDSPNSAFLILFLIPIVVSVLLVDRTSILVIAGLCTAPMFVLTALQIGLVGAFNATFVPIAFGWVLAFVLYVNSSSVWELIYWATDIQKKDANRAEVFYQQKQQLSDALLHLSHAKSKLEQMNDDLAQARQTAEQASNAKSLFLSNMSHELRTPLNVIIGYTSTMLDTPMMYGNISLPPTYRHDIELVKNSGYHLLGLINDILDLSKIEAGKLELHCTEVDLQELFKGILATAIGLVKDKPIQMRPDFPADLPQVWADPIRVRQIILNLVSNAVKFTKSGSVTLRAFVENDHVTISVIDTGIGIPEKALPHIFDRFEQAERDTDKLYGGTGLGLDISRQLAQMHGGDLTAESQVGQGSTFTFSLPILTGGRTTAPSDETVIQDDLHHSVTTLEPADDELAATILLVEDEASLRDMMRRALESTRRVVVDIQDGAQVIDMATGLLPELIILDIRLPNVGGWELLNELKRNPETAVIPVIVCTVSDDEQRALNSGAACYLRKPFSGDELLACVEARLPHSIQDNHGS